MAKISVITPTIRGISALLPVERGLKKQDIEYEWLIDISDGKKPDLPSAYNRLLRRANGELIVFIQDNIEISEGALEKIWNAYQENKDAFFTFPVEHEGKGFDWRRNRDDINWMEWEIDFGAVPLSALKAIGGFDEWMDEHESWGFDNVNIGLRAELAGYTFKCLKDISAFGYSHEETKLKHTRNPELHNMRLDQFRRGLKVHYLG